MKKTLNHPFQRLLGGILVLALSLECIQPQTAFGAPVASSEHTKSPYITITGKISSVSFPAFEPHFSSNREVFGFNRSFGDWREKVLTSFHDLINSNYALIETASSENQAQIEQVETALTEFHECRLAIIGEVQRIKQEHRSSLSRDQIVKLDNILKQVQDHETGMHRRAASKLGDEIADRLRRNMGFKASLIIVGQRTIPGGIPLRRARRAGGQTAKPLAAVTTADKNEAIRKSKNWDAMTTRLVRWPTWAVFLPLAVPQIWTNIVNLAQAHPFFQAILNLCNSFLAFIHQMVPFVHEYKVAPGRVEGLAELAVIGIIANILADSLLISFFNKGMEYAPAIVQTMGVVMMSVILTQVAVAGFVPMLVWAAAMVVFGVHLWISWGKVFSKRDKFVFGLIPSGGWQKFMSLLGFYMLLPSTAITFGLGGNPIIMAAGFILGVGPFLWALRRMILEGRGSLSDEQKAQWSTVGGWLATIFFLLMPIAQLMQNILNPEGMLNHGLNPFTYLLGITGNLLMLPRALMSKNHIWFIGSAGGILGVYAVMLSLLVYGFIAGAALVPVWLVALTGTFMGMFYFAIKQNQKAFGYSSAWRSFDFLRQVKKDLLQIARRK